MELKKKLHLVIQLCEKHNITAYELGKIDGITTAGARKIIEGITKKPRTKTLDIILSYINSTINGAPTAATSAKTLTTNEPTATYQSPVSNTQLLAAIEHLDSVVNQRLGLLAAAAKDILLTVESTDAKVQDTQRQFTALFELLNDTTRKKN